MKNRFTIKNFRVFDKKGATIDIAPMTFLVGCNSSGKSSIVKALFLLKTFFQQKFSKEHTVIGSTIDFSVKPNNTLGRFRNVVNYSSHKKSFSLSFDTYSYYINSNVVVNIDFGEADNGDAVVTKVVLSIKDTDIVIASNGKDYSGNLNLLREAFKQYLIAIQYRNQVHNVLSNFWGFYPIDTLGEKEEAEIYDLREKALLYCDEKYLNEVYSNPNIGVCTGIEENQLAINRFAEEGILTYFAILDDLKDITAPNDVCAYMKSKVKDDEFKDLISKSIDIICNDYSDKGDASFLVFYRKWEERDLIDNINIRVVDELLSNRFKSYFSNSYYNTLGPISKIYNNKRILEGGIIKDKDKDCELRMSYSLIKDVLMHISEPDSYHTQNIVKLTNYCNCNHYLYHHIFKEYVNRFLLEVFSKDITENLEYVGSSRIQVRRLYPLEDKTEFSELVRRYFIIKSNYLSLNPPISITVYTEDEPRLKIVSDFMPGDFMNNWLRKFKIGDHMSLEMDKNGLGLLLKLHSKESDKKGRLLADVGHGITQLFSILLQIEEVIMSGLFKKYQNKVGHRVLVDYFDTPLDAHTIAIEEPEIHLHPKFQSLLAEMFLEAYKDYNIQFVVETHSEYLLRKVQTLIGKKTLTPEEVSMIYVEDDEEVKWGTPKVRRIPIKEDGRLSEPFSPGFYDEADNLSLELFTNMGK